MAKRFGKKNRNSDMSIEAYACSCGTCSCHDSCTCYTLDGSQNTFQQNNMRKYENVAASNGYSKHFQK